MELPLLERVGGDIDDGGGARGDALVQCVVGHGDTEGTAVLGSYLGRGKHVKFQQLAGLGLRLQSKAGELPLEG